MSATSDYMGKMIENYISKQLIDFPSEIDRKLDSKRNNTE